MFKRLCGVLCVVFLVVTMARATTALLFTNEALSQVADMVVIGKCVSVKTVWVDRTLVTVALIQLSENLKGTSSQVTVVLPGGIDANRPVPIMMSYPGAPQIRLDEEVFLFLEDETPTLGGHTVVGFSQGKFSIVNDSQGRKVVERDLTKVDLQNSTGISRGTRTLTRLEDFKEEIQKHLANR